MGILVLDIEPPLYVSLVHYQSVLRTERIEAGQREITFVITPQELLDDLANIRVALVDADTDLAIGGANVTLHGGSGEFLNAETDDQGLALLHRREPGKFDLQVQAAGYERFSRAIDAPPGELTDLGIIALNRELTVTGRVLDARGNPLVASCSLGVLDRSSGSITWLAIAPVTTTQAGEFEIPGLGRREYVLRTKNHDPLNRADPRSSVVWVSGNQIIDTRAGAPEQLEIRLKAAAGLTLSAANAAAAGMKFRVLDEQGLELARSTFYEAKPRLLLLPPGKYRAYLIDEIGRVQVEREVPLGPEGADLNFDD
jgi:hypothetical protein